jgi:O-antigen/teichoic acid export membrane protein
VQRSAALSVFYYAVATALVSGSNFLLVPLLIRGLGHAEFAKWATLEPLLLLFIPLTGLGMQLGVMRILADRDGNLVFSATFPIYILTAAFIAPFGAIVIAFNGFEFSVVAAAMLIVFFEGLTVYFINFWRARNHPGKYALVEGGRAFSLLIAVVVVLNFGSAFALTDFVTLRTIVAIFAVMFALYGLRTRFSPDLAMAKKAIAFGFPMTVSALFLSVMLNFDRYPVYWLGGDSTTTSYVAHVKLAQVLGAALAPFYVWYAPMAMKRLSKIDAQTRLFFSQSFYVFASVNIALTVGLWIMAPTLWQIIFPSITFDKTIFATLLVGVSIFSCGNPLSIGTLIDGHTNESISVSLSAVLLGLILIWPLSLQLNVIGVAAAKCAACILYATAFAWRTWVLTKVSYSWERLSFVALVALLLSMSVPGFMLQINSLPTALLAACTSSIFCLLLAYFVRPLVKL